LEKNILIHEICIQLQSNACYVNVPCVLLPGDKLDIDLFTVEYVKLSCFCVTHSAF